MGLGDFFSNAGAASRAIGTSEDRARSERQNQLAIEQQNRLDALRREMVNAPMPAQLPAFQYGDQSMLPVQQITPTAVNQPAVAVPNQQANITQLNPNSPQARALYQERLDRLRTGEAKAGGVPLYDPNSPIQAGRNVSVPELNINVPGYDASQIKKNSLISGGKQVINSTLAEISTKLATGRYKDVPATNVFSGITNYFMGTPQETAVRDRAIKADNWYKSKEANLYFQQNPGLLLEAKDNPLGFYEKLSTGQQRFETAAAVPPPIPATPKAARFDRMETPYEGVIQQSATQYGIDPIVLKRLLASESSLQADPTGNRGIARGIAQVHVKNIKSGMITLDDALNPNAAIPFAAKLLGQYLQESGGNYEVALQKYKGAISTKGKQDMAPIINDILSGRSGAPTQPPQVVTTQPQSQTQPQPPQVATTQPQSGVATAPVEIRTSADFYRANPNSIPYDMQMAQRQRAEIEQLAGMYQRSGMGDKYMEARAKLMEIDSGMTYLQGMQGLQEFQLANDPRRLAAVWSQYAGVPVGIQPRTDGKYNIIVNGQKTKDGVSASDIADSARSAFDQTYRKQKSEASAVYSMEQFKTQLKMQENQASELAKMIKDIAVERVKGNNAQALEWAKANFGWDIKPSGSGDGTVIIKAPGAAPYVYNPSGRAVEIDGVKIQTNAAYPIAGLPSYGGMSVR